VSHRSGNAPKEIEDQANLSSLHNSEMNDKPKMLPVKPQTHHQAIRKSQQ